MTGALAVHIHLGDGTFVGALAGHHQLDPDSPYTLRVRFKDGALPPADPWSPWSIRSFRTGSASVIEPLVLSDVSRVPEPRWQDAADRDLTLPAGAALRLELPGAGSLLEFHGPGSADGAPRELRRRSPRTAPSAWCARPASRRSIFRPRESRSRTEAGSTAGSTCRRSRSRAGRAWRSGSPRRARRLPPTRRNPARAASRRRSDDALSAAPIPWAVKQPGFVIEPVATGFQLPVNIAFLTNPGPGPGRSLLLRDRALRQGPHGHPQRRGFGLCDRPAQLRSDRRLSGLGRKGPDGHRRRPGFRRRVRRGRRGGPARDGLALSPRHPPPQHRRRPHGLEPDDGARFSDRAARRVAPDLQRLHRPRRQAVRAHRRRALHDARARHEFGAGQDPARRTSTARPRRTTRSTTRPTG